MRKGILIIVAIAAIALVGFISIQPETIEENEEEVFAQEEPGEEQEEIIIPSRESKIHSDVIKITPETDKHPPITISSEYHQPVPLPYPINTKGAEDSAYMLPSGETLYFWFTPDTLGDVHARAQFPFRTFLI
jgi:hypothetical protein